MTQETLERANAIESEIKEIKKVLDMLKDGESYKPQLTVTFFQGYKNTVNIMFPLDPECKLVPIGVSDELLPSVKTALEKRLEQLESDLAAL